MSVAHDMTAETASEAKPALPLLALAVGAFCLGVTEFSPMGLLPEIAGSIGVSLPKAGALVSAYALGVMAGAPTMTLLLARLRQKHTLMVLMALFVLGNGLAAVAPSFLSLMAARVLTSLAHGAYFGIGTVLAVSMVPSGRQASALATVLMGLTIANVGGVPVATWLGQHLGWRIVFAGIAALGLLSLTLLQLALPAGSPCGAPNLRRELAILFKPSLLLALATTVGGSGTMFATYTYIAPLLHALIDADGTLVTMGLVGIGVGFTIGNIVGGRFADRAAVATLVVSLLLLALVSALLPFLLRNPVMAVMTLVAWGAAAFGVVPPVQVLVMRRASEAPGLASSVNIGAFNLGNALGAAVGGGVLSAGFGFKALGPAGAVLALASAVLVGITARRSPAG